jgi:CYTH domain-containing protein
MYNKEIERKWLVKKELLPDMTKYPHVVIKQGYLSQLHDSLMVRVRSIDDKTFSLDLKDSGTKIRNEITYKITKDEFDISYALAGQKTITKRRFSVPSTGDKTKILEVDFIDELGIVLVEYEGETEDMVDNLKIENWFGLEVTEDYNYTNIQLAYKKTK